MCKLTNVVLVSLLLNLNIFHIIFSVSFVDFEHLFSCGEQIIITFKILVPSEPHKLSKMFMIAQIPSISQLVQQRHTLDPLKHLAFLRK